MYTFCFCWNSCFWEFAAFLPVMFLRDDCTFYHRQHFYLVFKWSASKKIFTIECGRGKFLSITFLFASKPFSGLISRTLFNTADWLNFLWIIRLAFICISPCFHTHHFMLFLTRTVPCIDIRVAAIRWYYISPRNRITCRPVQTYHPDFTLVYPRIKPRRLHNPELDHTPDIAPKYLSPTVHPKIHPR